ncbi:MAG: sigma-70 family RNA polymerase sigma factor [Planctomycetota bacterium]
MVFSLPAKPQVVHIGPVAPGGMRSDDKTRELVARLRQGDQEARNALLVQHLPALVGYVRLYAGAAIRERESVSDLVQSACADALEDLRGFEYQGETQLRHWLARVALHKVQKKHRHYTAQCRDRAREVSEAAFDEIGGLAQQYATICPPSRHARARETLAAFEEAFGELPEAYRDAIAMRRILGLSYAEVAGHLGRTEKAVRNLVHRGVAMLAVRVGTADS